MNATLERALDEAAEYFNGYDDNDAFNYACMIGICKGISLMTRGMGVFYGEETIKQEILSRIG